MYLAFTILIFFKLPFYGKSDSIIEPQQDLIGTWITIPNDDRFNPIYKVVINNDLIFISREEYGGWGYDQILTYNNKNDTLFAREIEYMSFDLNVGFVTGHFKYREKNLIIVLYGNEGNRKLILYPLQPGTVLRKETNQHKINVNFDEKLSKWRLSPHFKCDYKKNGRPKTSAIRKHRLIGNGR